VEIARVRHAYASTSDELEIRFFAARLDGDEVAGKTFEQIAWVLPRELSQYDFLAANRNLVADLATGRIKPGEILQPDGQSQGDER
jgi:8-oxo-dGTP diphosphatase